MGLTFSRLSTFIVLTFAFAPAAAQTVRHVGPRGHLYVAARHAILRYPLVDGHPAEKPDLRISGYGEPIATGPHGDVVATGRHDVALFPLGATQPTLVIPVPLGPIAGVAEDGNGDVYVSNDVSASQGDVVIYDGTGKPINTIALDNPGPIALGTNGTLYAVTGQFHQYVIDSFLHPQSDKTPFRSFTSNWLDGTLSGISVASGVLYLTNQNGSVQAFENSFIYLFPSDTHGVDIPPTAYYETSPIALPLGSAAFSGTHLFVGIELAGLTGPVAGRVFEYDDGPGIYYPDARYKAGWFPTVAVGL